MYHLYARPKTSIHRLIELIDHQLLCTSQAHLFHLNATLGKPIYKPLPAYYLVGGPSR